MTDLGKQPPAAPPAGGPRLYVEQTPPVPVARLLQLELRKAVDTLAGFWLLMASAVLLIIVEGFFLLVGVLNENAPLAVTAFTQPAAYVLQPLLATLMVLLVTSEWGQRTAMVTFALEPRRTKVLLAKLAAGLLLGLALVVVLLVIALLCSIVVGAVRGDGFDWDLSLGDVLGLVLFEAVGVLIGFALAALILNTPGAIGAFPIVMYAIPSGLGIVGLLWSDFGEVGRFVNLQSALAPMLLWSVDSGSDWARLVVSLLVWVAIPLVLGLSRILRAEVK